MVVSWILERTLAMQYLSEGQQLEDSIRHYSGKYLGHPGPPPECLTFSFPLLTVL